MERQTKLVKASYTGSKSWEPRLTRISNERGVDIRAEKEVSDELFLVYVHLYVCNTEVRNFSIKKNEKKCDIHDYILSNEKTV